MNENHYISRTGWLRAAVLGANDGLLSTASIIVGVAASSPNAQQILLAGTAGLAAGAMSMAAGEYVSVSSQADTEKADLSREGLELEKHPEFELAELAKSFEDRGVSPETALNVAKELTHADALGAHAREELGISTDLSAKPVQAALASAVAFAVGAAMPLIVSFVVPLAGLIYWVAGTTLVFLAVLGALGAIAGGARILPASLRVMFWGIAAMAVTAAIGRAVGTEL